MKHEKIITKNDNYQYKIEVTFYVDSYIESPIYKCSLMKREKGKKLWVNAVDTNSFTYRNLSMNDRAWYYYDSMLKYVTEEEINQAKLELWEKLKPIR